MHIDSMLNEQQRKIYTQEDGGGALLVIFVVARKKATSTSLSKMMEGDREEEGPASIGKHVSINRETAYSSIQKWKCSSPPRFDDATQHEKFTRTHTHRRTQCHTR